MGTQIAFMSLGGVRADIAAGVVSWGALFTVQPFGNSLVHLDPSGARVLQLLEQRWLGQPFPRVLEPSGIT